MVIDFSFDVSIALILIICTLSQSIFGVGLLLWGTPTLLLLGFGYSEALLLLLPISMIISVIQFAPHLNVLEHRAVSHFMVFALPFMILSFFIILEFAIDATLFVGCALILAGFLRTKFLQTFNSTIYSSKNFLLPIIGIVHGMSNLGGSILVVWASYTSTTKLAQRTIIAVAYTALSIFQMVVLAFNDNTLQIPIVYIAVCLITYALGSRYVFSKINEQMFYNMLTALIFAMALLLIIKTAQ